MVNGRTISAGNDTCSKEEEMTACRPISIFNQTYSLESEIWSLSALGQKGGRRADPLQAIAMLHELSFIGNGCKTRTGVLRSLND